MRNEDSDFLDSEADSLQGSSRSPSASPDRGTENAERVRGVRPLGVSFDDGMDENCSKDDQASAIDGTPKGIESQASSPEKPSTSGGERARVAPAAPVATVDGRLQLDLWDLLLANTKCTHVYHYDGLPDAADDATSRVEAGVDQDKGLRGVAMDSLVVGAIASGVDHAALLSAHHMLYLWGDNSRSQLGFETKGVAETRPGYPALPINLMHNASAPQFVLPGGKPRTMDGGPPLIYPRPMPFFTESNVTHVACGDGFTLCVVDNRTFYSWGDNSYGQLGFEDTRHRAAPSTPPPLRGQIFRAVVAGRFHCAAVVGKEAATGVYTWGCNSHGQLGINSVAPRSAPKIVKAIPFSSEPCAQISLGEYHTLAVTQSGKVFSWGRGAGGRLGHGNDLDCLRPRLIEAFATGEAYREPSRQAPVEVVAVAAGAVSMAVDIEGNAYLWGEDPMLGHAVLSERDAKVPLRVEWLPSPVKALSVGRDHCAVVTRENQLVAWGHKDASILECTSRVIAAPGSNSRLSKAGWRGHAAVVALPEISGASAVASMGGQCILRLQPAPYFPHGEILNRALYSLFEWWGRYTRCARGGGGALQLTRTGWTLMGRALRLIDNQSIHSHWHTYLDQERVLTHSGELSAAEKNCMSVDTFLRAITKVAEERYPQPPELHPPRGPSNLKAGSRLNAADLRMKALMQLQMTPEPWEKPASRLRKKSPSKRPWGAPPPPPRVELHKRERNKKDRAKENEIPTYLLHVWVPRAVKATRILITNHLPSLRASSAPRTLQELHREVMDQKTLAYFEGGALEMMMQIFSFLAWNADLAISAETSLVELQESLAGHLHSSVSLDRLAGWAMEAGLCYTDAARHVVREEMGGVWGEHWRQHADALNFPEMLETLAACSLSGIFPHSVKAMMAHQEGVSRAAISASVSTEEKMEALVAKVHRWFEKVTDPDKFKTRKLDFEELEEQQATVYGAFCVTRAVSKVWRRRAAPTTIHNPASNTPDVVPPTGNTPAAGGTTADATRGETTSSTLGTSTSTTRLNAAATATPVATPPTPIPSAPWMQSSSSEEPKVCITRMGFRKLARATRLPDNRLLVTYLDALFNQLVQVPELPPTPASRQMSLDRASTSLSRTRSGGSRRRETSRPVTPAPTQQLEPAMNYAVFRQALGMVAAIKFPGKTPADAFATLVEEQMVPFNSKGGAPREFSSLMDDLLEPEVTAVLSRFQSSLQRMFRAYCGLDSALGYTNRLVTWELLERLDCRLTPHDVLMLCQDKKVVPKLLSKEQLEEVFVMAHIDLDVGSKDAVQINYSEFLDVLGCVALTVYQTLPITIEQKVEKLFQHCKLKDASAHAPGDPYAKWWETKLEVQAESGWYWGSSDEYPPSLVRDVVRPPKVPSSVKDALKQAAECCMQGKLKLALQQYHSARDELLDLCAQGLTPSGRFFPSQTLFFAIAIGGVLEIAGQEAEALLLYRSVLSEAEKLEEGHPDEAIVHSALGAVYYHQHNYQMAFRAFVFTMVLREQSPVLSERHPDTAAAYNNLGCCLERLGKTGQAMGFLKKAHAILYQLLGSDHPRTNTVSRNINRIQCKSMQMQVPEKLSTDLKKLLKEQDAQPSFSEEVLETWKKMKKDMYGEGRKMILEEQNSKVIKFFFTPIGVPDPLEEARKRDEEKKANAVRDAGRVQSNKARLDEPEVYDPKKETQALILNIKPQNLKNAVF